MKPPSFFEGVALALVASLGTGALSVALGLVLPMASVLRLLIAGLGFAYTVYLLCRSREKVGRLTVLAVWAVAAVLAWVWSPPGLVFLSIHLGLVWLVRSLYFHASLPAVLADLALHGLALATALWALANTGSLFLGVWCFFLVQALFTAIPDRADRREAPDPPAADRFQQAHRSAEAALRRLSSPHES